MSIYLIRKQWGYQTCCPDEENTIGYFKPEDPDKIEFYSKPTFDSDKLEKSREVRHERWKFNNSSSLKMNLEQMDERFGIIYTIENTDVLIGKSNSIWGWEKVKDKENKITWIRIDQDNDVWAPYDSYDYSTSDEEEEEEEDLSNYDINKLQKNQDPDQGYDSEVENFSFSYIKKHYLDLQKKQPTQKKQKY